MNDTETPTRREMLVADILLFVAAAIWGMGVVAQRMGMVHMGPYLFTAVRFTAGGLALLPLAAVTAHRAGRSVFNKALIADGIKGGAVFALASITQQVGIVYTTAGNAGFITGLYVVIVPIVGIFMGKKAGAGIWLGAALAAAGLFFLSGAKNGSLLFGDMIVLFSAAVWAWYFILIGKLVRKHPALPLSTAMFVFCGLFSFIPAVFLDDFTLQSFVSGWKVLAYASFLSITVAFTLQISAQKKTVPEHAAIISSLEGVFAVIGGVLILSESINGQKILGCLLMLAGCLVVQLGKRNTNLMH